MRLQVFWSKLRKHIIVWAIVLALIILVGVAVFTVISYRRAATELIIERDQQVTYLSASRLKDEFSKFSDLLSAIAIQPEISSGDALSKQAVLHQFLQRIAVFDGGVLLLDNFGKIQASEPDRPEMIGQDWSNSGLFQKILDSTNVTFSDAYKDEAAGSDVVAISVPIMDEKGEFAGALVGIFQLGQSTVSSFYASIVRLHLGQSGDTYVIDGNGRILYDSGFHHAGKGLDAIGLSPADLTAQTVANRTRTIKGHQVILAHAPIPGTSWTLVTEDDWAILTRSTKGYINTLIVLLILGMVLPAAGVLLLLRQQNLKIQEREQSEQENWIADQIQQNLLPKHAPVLPGWQISWDHQPASQVVGDYYAFKFLADGRLMIAMGDVKDSGIAASIVMTSLRTTLHGTANRLLSPGEALECSNALLCPDIEQDKSASCLYSILEPATGQMVLANAGHPLPYHGGKNGPVELTIGGAPLGLNPDHSYEQSDMLIGPGEWVLFYSDGLLEAQNRQGQAFGKARLEAVLRSPHESGQALKDKLLFELREFTGDKTKPKDTITLIVIERLLENQT